ncbi:MAG: hypothetical protein WC774_01620 [Candidatus Gracilibacteria bacterium]|jgi:hypothetical protein
MKSLFFPRLGAILGIFFIYIGAYLFIMITSTNVSDKHSSLIQSTFALITPYLSNQNNTYINNVNTSVNYPAPTSYSVARVNLTISPTPIALAVTSSTSNKTVVIPAPVRHSH